MGSVRLAMKRTLVAAVLGAICFGVITDAAAQGTEPAKVKGPVELTLYLTSVSAEAPAVLRTLETVMGLFGNQIKLTVEFFGSLEEGKLIFEGGDKERTGDLLLACAGKLMTKPVDYLRFVNCMASETGAIETSLKLCAEALAVPKGIREKLDTCRNGADGTKLLDESVRRTMEANVSMSPMLLVQGVQVTGAVRTLKLAQSICALQEKKSPACAKLPEVKKYVVTLVQDKRCTDPELSCSDEFIGEVTGILEEQIFVDGVEFRRLDYTEPAGREFFDKEKIPALPAFMLEKSIEADSEVMERLGRFLRKSATGNWYFLNAGQSYDPTKEICDNQKDDNEDGKVDCDDDSCKAKVSCRPEQAGLVELFIMSYCPYGVMAVNELKRLQEAFGKDVKVEIHYVLANEDGEIRSLHGEEEILEDARQLCVAKSAAAKLLPYMWCLYKDGEAADPKTCLQSVGLKADEIEACATGEAGKQMLLAETKLAETLEIEASPTWIVHGKVKFNSIDASEVAAYLCNEKFKVPGCEKAIPKKGDQPAGSCN